MRRYKLFGILFIILGSLFVGGISEFNFLSRINYNFRGETKIVFVGDIMMGRHVETLMEQSSGEYPFVYVAEFLRNADIAIGNLEGVIQTAHVHTPDFTTRFSFGGEVANILSQAGFGAMSMGNNHTFDYGNLGYKESRNYLSESNIAPFGNPITIGEESFITIKKHEDITFVSINDTFGVARQNEAVQLISHLHKQNKDLIFVSIHWGDEYELTSNSHQKELAHILIDAGADAIIGHHPHVVQEIEVYKDKPIFYSLGNFVFDQYFSREVEEGLLLEVVSGPSKVKYILHGIQSEKSQPQFMLEQEAILWRRLLALRSDRILKYDILSGVLEFDKD